MVTTRKPDGTPNSQLEALRAGVADGTLSRDEAAARARQLELAVPEDFFRELAAHDIVRAIKAPQRGPRTKKRAAGGLREAAVRELAKRSVTEDLARAKQRLLPENMPALLPVGESLNLKKMGETADMVCYLNYVNGRPTLMFMMAQFHPATALDILGSYLSKRRGVVLADRDGVLKDSRFLNTSAKEEAADVMLESAKAASKKLHDANVGLVVFTNQGGYELGKMSFAETLAINVRVMQQLADAGGHVDAVIICPFTSKLQTGGTNGLDARKPASGMPLFVAHQAAKHDVPVLGGIGDQVTDGAALHGVASHGLMPGAAAIKFYPVTDAHGRWVQERQDAQRKGETLPTLDTSPAVYEEGPNFAGAVDKILAALT